MLEDAPLTLKLDTGKTWSPQNYDKTYRGPVPAVRALAESLNTPTVRLGMDVGPKRVSALMKGLGLEQAPRPLPSMLLGSVALAPIEVAQIYNSLANGGFRSPLKAVRAVLDADGKPLERYQLKINRAADPAAVQELNASLTQVVARGTGPRGAHLAAAGSGRRRQDRHVGRPAGQLVRRLHQRSRDRGVGGRRRQLARRASPARRARCRSGRASWRATATRATSRCRPRACRMCHSTLPLA